MIPCSELQRRSIVKSSEADEKIWVALEYSTAPIYAIRCQKDGIFVSRGSGLLKEEDIPEGIWDREWFDDLMEFHEANKEYLIEEQRSVLIGRLAYGEFILEDIRMPYGRYLSYENLEKFASEFGIATPPMQEFGTYKDCLETEREFRSDIPTLFGIQGKKDIMADGILIRPLTDLYFKGEKTRPIVVCRSKA